MIKKFGKTLSVLLLLSFLTVALLGFAVTTHDLSGINDTCPFFPMGETLCFGSITSLMHHVSGYFSFLNITVNEIYLSFLISFIIFVFFKTRFSFWLFKSIVQIYFYAISPVRIFLKRNISKWLALFEHSPSLV